MIEAELPDGRILEFPDGTDQAVIDSTVKNLLSEVPAKKETWIPPETAAHPAVRATYGVSALPVGAAQLTSKALETMPTGSLPTALQPISALVKYYTPSEKISEAIRQYEEAKRQGGVEGFDWWELGGMAASGMVPGALGGATLKAATIPGRIGAGAAEGAAYGAAMPVTDEDFAKAKAEQVFFSGLFGGGISGTSELGRKMFQYGKELFSPVKTAEDYVKKIFGGDKEKYKQAVQEYQERLPGYNPTVAETLGQQQRRFKQEGVADLYSKEAIQLSKDLQRVGQKLDEAGIEADIKMRELVSGEKITKAQEETMKQARKAQADVNYSKATGTIPFESNRQLVENAMLKAEQKKAQAADLQGRAMQDYGRFQTLAEQQATRATRTPPEVDPMLTRLTGQRAPTSREMGDLPGQPRVPARYTPQRSVEEASREAAKETSGIAKQRLDERNLHKEISGIFQTHAKGTDTAALADFMNRPSVKKALKGVKEATEEAPQRYGKWPKEGEPFTVEQLGRLKREIADTVRKEAEEGTIKATQESEILATLDAFNDFLKRKSSAYRFADEEYAKASVPIKRGVVSRELESTLFPEGRIRQGAMFIKRLDDKPWMRKLTKGREKSIDDIFETESVEAKRAVKEMLLDQWETKMVKGTSKIKDLDGKIELQLPHILSRPIVITNAVLKHFGRDLTPDLHKQLEMIMRDPNKFVQILEGPAESTATRAATDFVRRLGAMVAAQEAGEQ